MLEESWSERALSTKFMNSSLVSLSSSNSFLNTSLGMDAHKNSHLFDNTLVLAASFMSRNDKMCWIVESGKLLIVLFPAPKFWSKPSFEHLALCIGKLSSMATVVSPGKGKEKCNQTKHLVKLKWIIYSLSKQKKMNNLLLNWQRVINSTYKNENLQQEHIVVKHIKNGYNTQTEHNQ